MMVISDPVKKTHHEDKLRQFIKENNAEIVLKSDIADFKMWHDTIKPLIYKSKKNEAGLHLLKAYFIEITSELHQCIISVNQQIDENLKPESEHGAKSFRLICIRKKSVVEGFLSLIRTQFRHINKKIAERAEQNKAGIGANTEPSITKNESGTSK